MSLNLEQFHLNASQLEAVQWQDGPLMVLAGPGSGKTRVLTCRIARLIGDSPDARFRVLGITFTNKAATEMRQRIDATVRTGRERAILTTFHAFGAEILRQHGSHVGVRPDFGILAEQADREAVLTEAIQAIVREGADFQPKSTQLLPIVTRLLEECVTPADVPTVLARHPNAETIAAIYGGYRTQLVAANQLDFPALLALAVELLESKPAVAKQLRRVYPYVCVDEFQDTNSAQFRLLVQLVPETAPNLFVVADDDQVIYQWNGASPTRLHDLCEHFAMPILQLPENYRCPPDVIRLANSLIAFNDDRSAQKQPLVAHKACGDTDAVHCHHAGDFAAELDWIGDRLLALPPAERRECVILARRKKLLDDAVTALTNRSIGAYVAIRKNEFQSAPYRYLHATLRLANAPQDREQLRKLSRAFFDLEGIKVEVEDVIARAAIDQGGYLRAWLDVVEGRDGIEASTATQLAQTRRALADRLDYWAFVDSSHNWFTGLANKASGAADESAFLDFEDEKEIWDSLRKDIAGHYQLAELSLHNFLQELDLRAKEKPAPPDAVRCLTIAAAKGMEFKHVFVIGMVEDELPSYHARKKGDSSAEMREERRNCFVAITRAEETLTLTLADRYFGYAKVPSRFLAEMGFEL